MSIMTRSVTLVYIHCIHNFVTAQQERSNICIQALLMIAFFPDIGMKRMVVSLGKAACQCLC